MRWTLGKKQEHDHWAEVATRELDALILSVQQIHDENARSGAKSKIWISEKYFGKRVDTLAREIEAAVALRSQPEPVLMRTLHSMRNGVSRLGAMFGKERHSGSEWNMALGVILRNARSAHAITSRIAASEMAPQGAGRDVTDEHIAGLRKTAAKYPDLYSRDIYESLGELQVCLANHCYIAVMCLCGKVLEDALKLRLSRLDARSCDAQMRKRLEQCDYLALGGLVTLLDDLKDQAGRLPEGLRNDVNKITLYRNSYAHSNKPGEPPIPSENDARSVIHSLLDVLDRSYAMCGAVAASQNT
jgi:hypothetical protein